MLAKVVFSQKFSRQPTRVLVSIPSSTRTEVTLWLLYGLLRGMGVVLVRRFWGRLVHTTRGSVFGTGKQCRADFKHGPRRRRPIQARAYTHVRCARAWLADTRLTCGPMPSRCAQTNGMSSKLRS